MSAVKPINDPECPCCLTPTLGNSGHSGKEPINPDESVQYVWWKASCSTCRTVVERVANYDEQVFESEMGRQARVLRHLHEQLETIRRIVGIPQELL